MTDEIVDEFAERRYRANAERGVAEARAALKAARRRAELEQEHPTDSLWDIESGREVLDTGELP